MLPKFVPYSLGFRVWGAQLSRGKGDRSKVQSITNFCQNFLLNFNFLFYIC